MLASLVEICKINAVEPQACFTNVITQLINGNLQSRLDKLLPWAYTLQDIAISARLHRPCSFIAPVAPARRLRPSGCKAHPSSDSRSTYLHDPADHPPVVYPRHAARPVR